MRWTETMDAELRQHVAAGQLSFRGIGCLLGVSRNAAIGRSGRLGLRSSRPRSDPRTSEEQLKARRVRKAERGRMKRAQARAVREALPPEPPFIDDSPPPYRRCTLLDLTAETCRYPVGDPGTEGFFFCGIEPIPGRPYCLHHHLICHDWTRRSTRTAREGDSLARHIVFVDANRERAA